MPVMPGAGVHEARRRRPQRGPECFFAEMLEAKTRILPCAPGHDPAEEKRCVAQCFRRGLPPAYPRGNGLEPRSFGLLFQHGRVVFRDRNPNKNRGRKRAFWKAALSLGLRPVPIGVEQLRAEENPDEGGEGEVGAEGDAGGPFAAADEDHQETDDRADD